MKHEKDYIEDITDYLRKNLKKGYTKDSLKWALINQGHSRREVEKAIQKVDMEMVKEAPVLKTKPVITHEVVEVVPEEKKSFWKRLFG